MNYVMFCDGTHWFKGALKKGFSHCYVLKQWKETFWILIDPTDTHLNLRPVITKKFLPNFLQTVKGHQWVGWEQEKNHHGYIRHFNCVNFVKYILGIHQPKIFTPWQLYTYLEAENERRLGLGFNNDEF